MRHSNAKRLRSRDFASKRKSGRLFDSQAPRIRVLEYAFRTYGRPRIRFPDALPATHETACVSELALIVDRGRPLRAAGATTVARNARNMGSGVPDPRTAMRAGLAARVGAGALSVALDGVAQVRKARHGTVTESPRSPAAGSPAES